jgi:hypothetical protein
MRVCQFRHFGKWTTLRGNLMAACQEEQLSILQRLSRLSNFPILAILAPIRRARASTSQNKIGK